MTMFTFSLLNMLAIALMSTFTPAFARPDVFFAVTVPTGFRRTEAGRKIVRLYLLLGWTGTGFITLLASLMSNREAAPHVVIAGGLGIWFAAFLYGRRLAIPHAVLPDARRTAV